MNVLHLSTSDIGGGAAIAAYRLHDGLRRAGVRSRMAVLYRTSDDPDVTQVGPRRALLPRVLRRLDHERLRRSAWTGGGRPSGPFSGDRVPRPDPLGAEVFEADVLNLHWVAGLVDYRRFFGRVPPGKPLVWTLHDMAPFTGGCHYSNDCARHEARCGACPVLDSATEDDATRLSHDRRAAALARLSPATTRIVAPSRWLAAEARRSALFRRFDVEVIPYGLDTEVFAPRDRASARALFGLPQDRPVVLFAAAGMKDPRKGFDLLEAALAGLDADPAPVLAAAGGGPAPAGAVSLGHIGSARAMSFAYSAADLFVLPTRADNLPNVAIEAMACGTPVVGFDVGGVPDMVRPGVTGLLAPPEDVGALRKAILALLGDEGLRDRLSETCRSVAVAEYDLAVQAGRYRKFYERISRPGIRTVRDSSSILNSPQIR